MSIQQLNSHLNQKEISLNQTCFEFLEAQHDWRSKAQAEVDYIEEIDVKIHAYEFKWNPGTKSKFPPSFLEAYKPAITDVIHRDIFWQWLKDCPY